MTAGKGLHRTRPGHRVKRPRPKLELAQSGANNLLAPVYMTSRQGFAGPHRLTSQSQRRSFHRAQQPARAPVRRPGHPVIIVTILARLAAGISATPPRSPQIAHAYSSFHPRRPTCAGHVVRTGPPRLRPWMGMGTPDLLMSLGRAKFSGSLLASTSTARGPCDPKLAAGNVQASMSANCPGASAGVTRTSRTRGRRPGSSAQQHPLAEDATTA